MGNTIEVNLKEEKPVLEVTKALVAEFKEYISMADHSMTALAKSLDALKDACEMLLRQLQDSTSGTDREKVNSQEIVCHLLEMIDESVSGHKYVVMESLSKLLNLVWNVGKPCFDNTENIPLVFLVDKYKLDCYSAVILDKVSFNDLRIRSLQREIKILQDKYNASERELTNLNKREALYRKEIEILEKGNKAQKEKIVDLTEKQNHEVEVFDGKMFKRDDSKEVNIVDNSLKQEEEQFKKDSKAAKDVTKEYLSWEEHKDNDLEQELHNLKIGCSREIPVTVDKAASIKNLERFVEETKLREGTDLPDQEFTALTTKTVLHGYEYDEQSVLTRFKKRIKGDLYENLKMELATCDVNFEVSSWPPSHLNGISTNTVIIVPIFKVSSYETLSSKMQRALKETDAGKNVVILYFHDDDGQPLDCRKMNEFNYIGGIFKFRHFNMKETNTEMNNKNFKDLLQFLKSICLEGNNFQDKAVY